MTNDQFHNFKKFKPLLNKIPEQTRFDSFISLKKFNADVPKKTYA